MKRTTRTDATTSTRITNTNTTRSIINYNVARLHQDVYMLDLPTRTTTIMVVVPPSLVPAGTPGPRLVGLEIIPRWKVEYTTWYAIGIHTSC